MVVQDELTPYRNPFFIFMAPQKPRNAIAKTMAPAAIRMYAAFSRREVWSVKK